MHDPASTVVAIATPAGRGGIGAIRLSGPAAHAIAAGLFRQRSESKVASPGQAVFGTFLARDRAPVDRGYLIRFDAGRSFTGEPTAELWAHGSPAVLRELVEAALAAGACLASPGEFTYRALRNGRLDLAGAEAVRDLIAARTLWQARIAHAQSEGALSRRLAPVREALADLVARVEAAVEFADEADVDVPEHQLRAAIARVTQEAQQWLAGFRAGRVVREGAVVALTGLPNVGKSSLFNALLARERAIVSEVAGTTRDTIEDELDLEGVPVRLIDTAGLRDTADPIEGEGVRRANAAAREADLVILVLESGRDLQEAEATAIAAARSDSSLIVRNKADLGNERADESAPGLPVSATTGEGLEALRAAIREHLVGAVQVDDPIVTEARHARAIAAAIAALDRAIAALDAGLAAEYVLEDLRDSLAHLGEITGAFGGEELMERIFSTFCIGK